MLAKFWVNINQHKIKFLLVCLWLVILALQSAPLSLIKAYFGFVFLGLTGAIFANSTGAGGGVVFVPFFNQLSLSNTTIIATSFAIQCCGMSAGAITWWHFFKGAQAQNPEWKIIPKGLLIVTPFSVIGILSAQFGFADYTDKALNSLHLIFGVFSIFLALAIYASIPLMKRRQFNSTLLLVDAVALALVALVGGVITAWLSVGVGELVAVYLILRGFNITCAIALAVILSAFSVWSAIGYHLVVSQAIYWQIVIFAGAGAIIGGMIAKHLVLFFSISRLKLFFASWVMFMGIAGLPIW